MFFPQYNITKIFKNRKEKKGVECQKHAHKRRAKTLCAEATSAEHTI